jgi:drug/metabolite transporter (DMT)-like permease
LRIGYAIKSMGFPAVIASSTKCQVFCVWTLSSNVPCTIATGAFAGAVLGTAWGYRWGSLGAGMIGAVLGTIGGYAARTSLVAANGGRDRPVALGEDVLAVIAGVGLAGETLSPVAVVGMCVLGLSAWLALRPQAP